MGELSGGLLSEEATDTGAAIIDMSVSVESELGASLFDTETESSIKWMEFSCGSWLSKLCRVVGYSGVMRYSQ